jgi:dipeptidyl aminopeptidase/acylaminoacyl peptidase
MSATRCAFVLVCALAGVRASAAPAPAASSDTGGIEPYLRFNEVEEARLSPAGTKVALVTLVGPRTTLDVLDLSSHKRARFELGGEGSVRDIGWASDERLVFERLERRESWDVRLRTRFEIDAMNADGSHERPIFGRNTLAQEPSAGWVLSRYRDAPGEVLLATVRLDDVGDRDVWVHRLDAVDGSLKRFTRSPMPRAEFRVDEHGDVRLALAVDRSGGWHYFYRERKGSWVPLSQVAKGLAYRTDPVAYSDAERLVYLVERDDAGYAVVAQSLDTGERKELARNGIVPPSRLVLDARHRLVAVEFTPDLPDYSFVLPDHPLARALKGLGEAFPDERVQLVNASDDDKKALVRVFSDRDPGRLLVVDTATLSADVVAQVRPWVNPEDSAEVSAFHIRARDGTRIHGYVTLPRDGAGGAAPPLVVLPHGGPHQIRDRWDYDAESQLLARQGFAVLRVNYRGSGGYGALYEEAGHGHWGDRMIEDVIDATRFAIAKRWADPGRICIYGGSYGGYAALQAASLAPELFRCAVGYAGLYDLERTRAEAWAATPLSKAYWDRALGKDDEAMREMSPAQHADRITARVLLIHGGQDETCPLDQAERMKKALTAAGRPPEWMIEPAEAHGFVDPKARLRMYTRLLAFLRENTAPPSPSPAPAAP